MSADQLVMVTILVKLGVMASIASLLIRFGAFKRLLYKAELSLREKLVFALLSGMLLSVGVVVRLLLNYGAADLSLSGTLLVGLLTGPLTGASVGLMVGAPAAIKGELLALPLGVLYGVSAGVVRRFCRKEDIWSFSPLIFLNLYRIGKTAIRDRVFDWQIAIFAVTLALESLRIFVGSEVDPPLVFHLSSDNAWVMIAIYISTLAALGIPIKIWNSVRLEHKLAEQEVLVVRARLQALSSQINPHFLFNTLNSIASATRTNPEVARMLIRKLSSILRKLLQEQEHFIPLKEELEFIDAYLDIESVRFGSGKLVVEKEVDSAALDSYVPSMIVQPLVENAVKHGIASRLEGGRIVIRARRSLGSAVVEIEDNGSGFPENGAEGEGLGIGLSNVNERLKVIYGESCQLELEAAPERGTIARVRIPDVDISFLRAS
ncbi:MAG TPA: histidine kinase [Vicinamibacteria bacterium]|nr:histidine kinase [Vicinamibacteria bacterium]